MKYDVHRIVRQRRGTVTSRRVKIGVSYAKAHVYQAKESAKGNTCWVQDHTPTCPHGHLVAHS